MISIHRHETAASFSKRAKAWLLEREAEYNVIIGLLPRLESGDHRYQDPLYFATAESAGRLVGTAYRTPPFKLGLSRMPEAGLAPLADNVRGVYEKIPAVFAREEEACRFAEHWSERAGCVWKVGMRQRFHQLHEVASDLPAVAGRLRLATPADTDLLVDWLIRFADDAHTPAGGEHQTVERIMSRDGFHVWDDGRAVSMAAVVGRTPNGVRIGAVYTPPELRGRGYATAAVADLSQLNLDAGRSFCFLCTDLANPTSNAIYARIGYRPVVDIVDVDFEHEPAADVADVDCEDVPSS